MYELEPHRTCPVCGCPEYFVLASQEQLDYEKQFRERLFQRRLPGVPESMLDDLTVFTNAYPARLVTCRACGLVCRDPRFSSEGALRAYSSDDYSEEWMASTFSEYYDSYSGKMNDLKRTVGERANVLEVGSYVGGFLAAARDHGWTARGVDVGQRVGEFSRRKGLNVFTGTLFDAHLQDSGFDAVFVWVCFDQLPHPRRHLAEIRRVLRSGGWLFIQVPNGDYIKQMEQMARGPLRAPVCKALAYTGMAGFPYQLGYTPRVLRNLLSEYGFANVSLASETDTCENAVPTQRQIPEQRLYTRRIRLMSKWIARASANRMIRSPWLLATGQKA